MLAGLLLTFLVGILWTFVGVFYKMMAQWKLSVFDISLVTGPATLLLTLLFYSKTGALLSGDAERPDWIYILYVIFGGAVNAGGSLILQRSMIYGKSSVTWAIGQSSLVIPFVAISLLFSEPWSAFKISGAAAVLAGMAVLSCRNGEKSSELPRARYGLFLAFLAFAVLGLAQTTISGTSYLNYHDPGKIRPVLLLAGSFLATAAGKIMLKERGFRLERKAWLLIGAILVQGAVATCVQFIAMDRLAACRMNAVFFPFAVGVCIAGYAVCSVVFFKEKMTKFLAAGTLLVLTGIAFFCVSAVS